MYNCNFSFLFINLNESDPQNAFYRCFDAKLEIPNPQPESNGRGASSVGTDLRGVPRKKRESNPTRGQDAEASRG